MDAKSDFDFRDESADDLLRQVGEFIRSDYGHIWEVAACEHVLAELQAERARYAELVAERDKWYALAQDGIYVAAMIGLDCASALADLQESGVYKPRCSDGVKSNADARKDADKIREIYRRGTSMLNAESNARRAALGPQS